MPVSSLLSTEASADLSMHVLGALRERRVKRFLMRTSCSRGNEKHVRAEILPLIVDVDGRRCVRILLQDVTPTVHLEKLCDTAIASAQLSATFDSVESAAEVILRELAATLRAERGEYWAASDSATAWNLDAVWQVKDSADTEARLENTCAIAATQLRDRVGETRDVVEQFEDDSKADRSATRANRSPRLDGIALPVRSGDRFCGVVTFVGSRLRRADRATMAVLNAAAAQLGVVHRLAEQHDRLLESEQNLLQAQKVGSVGRFVGGIAHDFNNILTVIMGCGNLACDLVDEGSELEQLVDEIVDAGKRASDMTKRLLTMSQKLPRSTQSIDIHRRVDDALPLLNRLIDQRIELKVHSETSDCPVSFDASEFDQILLNLIVNARDAIKNSGHITIFVEQAKLSVDAAQRLSHGRPGDFIVLSVSDNGGGIDEATRERIFEPYFTTKAPGKGTGMGLATVDNLVRAAGGFLNVDSRVGVGTVVSIFFPRSKEYLRTLHVDGPLEMQGTGREKILLALQDDELRSLTERMLKARGYAVSQASDGEDAVNRVAETPSAIDLIVADANLPEGTIDKIVSSFRNRAKPIPLLFILTEATPSPLINHHLNNGVRSLHIPFTSDVLVFVTSAIAIAIAGVRAAGYADRLADRTGMGEALAGTVFLGFLTALPGLLASVTAAAKGHAAMAISNAMGGIAVQTAALAAADIAYPRANLEHAAASVPNMMQSTMLIALIVVVLSGISGPEFTLGHVHFVTPLSFVVAGCAFWLVLGTRDAPMWHPENTDETVPDVPKRGSRRENLPRLIIGLAIAAGVTGVGGVLVAETAENIVEKTSIPAVVVGGLFMALATSLPELVTSIAAVRRGALTLAVSDIVGGNFFDVLFIAAADIAYVNGSLYHADGVGLREVFLISLTLLLNVVLLAGLIFRQKRGPGNIGFESLLLLVLYIGGFLILAIAM
eukprot:g10248.t1